VYLPAGSPFTTPRGSVESVHDAGQQDEKEIQEARATISNPPEHLRGGMLPAGIVAAPTLLHLGTLMVTR
jgi:hypothetical protein